MKIKTTEVATQELERLDADVRGRVVSAIREALPGSVETDPLVHLKELEAEVRVHSVNDADLLVLYSLLDVDRDGVDEIVILTTIRRDELPHLSDSASGKISEPVYAPTGEAPKSARIGHELLSKIRHVEG